MSNIEFFVTPGYGGRNRDLFHYSHAVKIGDRIELAGQGAPLGHQCRMNSPICHSLVKKGALGIAEPRHHEEPAIGSRLNPVPT